MTDEEYKKAFDKHYGEGMYDYNLLLSPTSAKTFFETQFKPEWVSVEDRLPEFNKPVLAFCRVYGRYIGWYEFIGEAFGEKHGNWNDGKNLGVLPPLFWMPLPEPPQI